MSDSYNLSLLGMHTCFWCEPKNVIPHSGKLLKLSVKTTWVWPDQSQVSILSCLSCPGKVHTHLDSNFMILGGSYLNLFNAEGLVCFPGDSCFAFNDLRKREKGGKGEGERTKGRKRERERKIFWKKVKEHVDTIISWQRVLGFVAGCYT